MTRTTRAVRRGTPTDDDDDDDAFDEVRAMRGG
jgi:hypothetical protein